MNSKKNKVTKSLASINANIRSIPMLIPTHGTFLCLESNIPTRLSYRPPPAMLPTLVGSPSIVKGSPKQQLIIYYTDI